MVVSTKVKIVKTAILYTCVFLTSFCLKSFFSTLLDFTEILKSSVDIVSIGLSIRCIGGCFGSFLGGVLFNFGDRLSIIAIFLMIGGISSATIPNVSSLSHYYIFKFIIGTTAGVFRSGIIVTLIEMWQDKSRPFVQANSFIQILSAFATPLCLHPFLSPGLDGSKMQEMRENVTKSNSNGSHAFDFAHNIDHDIQSEIWIPYATLGGAMNAAAILVLLMQVWILKTSKSWKVDEIDTENASNDLKNVEDEKRNRSYFWTVVSICSFMVFLIQAKNIYFCQFWTTFVVYSDLEISKAKGNLMLSAFALSMGCGSLLNIFLSMKIDPIKQLSLLLSAMFLGNLIIIFGGQTSEMMLWIGGSLVSSGLGCGYATVINCLQRRIKMTNTVGALASFSSNFANACGLPVLIGYYIQIFPEFLIYCNFIVILLMVISMLGLKFMDKKDPNSK